MSYIQSYPTEHGLNVLSSEFKNTATQYVLLGASSHDAPENTWQEFHRANIESSFYDENGVLTFVLNLPIEQDLQKTMYKVLIVDSDNKAVTEAITPKIYLGKGIGGLLTLKTAIQGEAGEIVFKSSEFITDPEMKSIWLPPIYEKFKQTQFQPYDKGRIYKTGEVFTIERNNQIEFIQWYSNVEHKAGIDPFDDANYQAGWSDPMRPFYFIKYTGQQVGMPFFWLSEDAPDYAVIELNVDLPIAVYWRLANVYPHLVNQTTQTINTGEIRGEFLRVWDAGRGVDAGRVINSYQDHAIERHNHKLPTGAANIVENNGVWGVDDKFWTQIDVFNSAPASGCEATTAAIGFEQTYARMGNYADETRPRNTSRAMCITI